MQRIANLARNKKLVLPVHAFNILGGGSHAGNKLATQVAEHQDSIHCSNAILLHTHQPFTTGVRISPCGGNFF